MSETFESNDKATLKRINGIAKKIIEGKKTSELFRKHKKMLDKVKPQDIFALPMYQEDSEQTDETILKEAGKYVNLFHQSLERYEWDKQNFEFIRLTLAENEAIREKLTLLRAYFSEDVYANKQDELLEILNELNTLKNKFTRMQNVLFPLMEKHVPSSRPLRVLWMLENKIMDNLHHAIKQVNENDSLTRDIIKTLGAFYYELIGYFDKEELILLPAGAHYLPKMLWKKMMASAMEYGFVFIDVDNDNVQTTAAPLFKDGKFITETGNIDPEQLALIFNNLPIAITYVDEHDEVRYFNKPKERHFPRSKEVIGRKVQNCHPKKSVHVVEKILDSFRKKKKTRARFWMDFRGKKLLIVYYPVYDEKGVYRGVIETTQTIDDILDIKGEKRLLDWDS